MKMTDRPVNTPLTDLELDALFGAARRQGADPSADLLARIVADAEDRASAQAGAAIPDPAPGWIGRLLSAIGGWPAAAGLAAAGVTGLTIGILAPSTLETLSGGYLAASGYQLENLVVSYADLLEDG